MGKILARGWLCGFVAAGVIVSFAPSSRAAAPDAEQTARAYLAARPAELRGVSPEALRALHVRRVGAGATVTLRQTYRGLEVIGGEVTVRLDERGQARWVASAARAIPSDVATEPAVEAETAVRVALRASVFRDAPELAEAKAQHRLVVLALPEPARPRLAWEVTLPAAPSLDERLRVYVDAQTETALYVENLAAAAAAHLANLYPTNPVATPNRTQVTLDDLPEGATGLVGPDFETKGCVDLGTCVQSGKYSVHACIPQATASTNASGNFLDLNPPANHGDPTDAFAEVQSYYFMERFYAAARDWMEDPAFTLQHRVVGIVNVLVPTDFSQALCTGDAAPPGSTLGPINDAALFALKSGGYVPHDDATDWLVIGQAASIDNAYDGDTVFHEMGHGLIDTLTVLGHGLVWDAQGCDTTAPLLHEALADYFAAVISGDPKLFEYPSQPPEQDYTRTLDGAVSCPSGFAGEAHQNSSMWSQALWAARSALPVADRPEFDKAVVTAVSAFAKFETLPSVQAKLRAEVETRLGASAAKTVGDVLDARGLSSCTNRVIDASLGTDLGTLWSPGADVFSVLPVPGPAQFRITLAGEASEIRLAFTKSETSDAKTSVTFGFPNTTLGDPSTKLVLKAGSDPIKVQLAAAGKFAYDTSAEADVVLDAPGGGGKAVLPGPFPAGQYVLMLVGSSRFLQLEHATFTAPGGEAADGGIDDAGSGGAAGTGGSGAKPSSPGDDSGCGCRVPRRGGDGSGWLAAVAAAAVLVRRGKRRWARTRSSR